MKNKQSKKRKRVVMNVKKKENKKKKSQSLEDKHNALFIESRIKIDKIIVSIIE